MEDYRMLCWKQETIKGKYINRQTENDKDINNSVGGHIYSDTAGIRENHGHMQYKSKLLFLLSKYILQLAVH